MGPNCLMSHDDYLHFLIVLSGFPDVSDADKLQERLSQMMVKFILELITENKKEYVYYIYLFP